MFQLTATVIVASAEMTNTNTSASKQWFLIHWSRLAETSMPGLKQETIDDIE